MDSWDKRKEYFILGCILLVAALIRIWGVNFGFPGLVHYDERWFVPNSFCALTGKLNRVHSIFGSFLPFLTGLVFGVCYFVLRIFRVVDSPAGFFEWYLKDPSTLYLIGRIIFVFLGVGLVALTYVIGRKLYSKRVGLSAALLTTFTFLLVQQSKFMKGDTSAALLILLSFYYAISLIKNYTLRYYILCGVSLGLAIGAKYYSFVFILVPLFLHFTCYPKIQSVKSHLWLVYLVLSTGLTFLAVTPKAIIYPSQFLAQISGRNAFGAWIPTEGVPGSLFYIKEYLKGGMGLPFEVVAFLGCFYLLILRHPKDMSIFIFIFSFLFLLNFLTNFDRFAVPMIPFLAIAASKLLCDFTERIKYKEVILWVVSGLIILPSGIDSIKYNYLITQPDTRNIAKLWIEEHIPANSKVVNEGGSGPERISVLSAPIHKNKKVLLEEIEIADKAGLKGTHPRTLLKIDHRVTYDLKSVMALNWIYIDGAPTISIPTVDTYVQEGYEWIITSSWIRGAEEGEFPPEFIHSLQKHYELVKEFRPYPEFEWDYYCYRVDYRTLGELTIFDKGVIGGPTISIYRRRGK